MAQNEIEEMLVYNSQSCLQIEKLEIVLRVLRTFIKCHRVLFSDSSVELTKNVKLTVRMLERILHNTTHIGEGKCGYKWIREIQVPHLLEFFEGNTSLSYKYELNDFDLSECMDCLRKNLHEMLMMFLERVRSDCPEENLAIHRFIMQLKIVHKKMNFLRYLYATEIKSYIDDEKLECLETRIQFMASNVGQFCLSVSTEIAANIHETEVKQYGYDVLNKPSYLLCLIVLVELEMKMIFLNELKASKFTHSRTFKDMKLPEGFSHHLHSLLMYLRKEKLENFPDNVSAQNIIVAIEFLLVFLDADVSNHVINGNWLNEVMEKFGAIV